MKELYNTETILITSHTDPVSLSRAIYKFTGWENYVITAEITLDNKIFFRVDGGDPYTAHCLYGLKYCNEAFKGDIIVLENLQEIIGFRAVKEINNVLLTVNYYKEEIQ